MFHLVIVVLVARGERLEDDQPGELRLGLQEVDLVRLGEPGGLEAVGPHRGELGHVVHAVAVLHLDHQRGGVADDLVEARLLAPVVDPGQVLLEEVGVLLVAHGRVGGEIDHDVVVPSLTADICFTPQALQSSATSASSTLAHSGRRKWYSSWAGMASSTTPATMIAAYNPAGTAV